jgi:peroxiredoxin Q/BCP
MNLAVGAKAPDFSLPESNGTIRSLSEYLGKWVILYFYPKDDTPGCTKEACGFRDVVKEFTAKNAVVLGISKDSAASHQKFIQKYNLNFPLLSDDSKKVIQLYGAQGTLGTKRITYLIDPGGIIRKIYLQVDPVAHPAEIIKDINI